jgi:hypothetical protein
MRRAHRHCLALLTAALSVACTTAAPQGRSEHPIRRMVPIPICLRESPRNELSGPLRPEEYWPILWPEFHPNTGLLDPLARDCAGHQPLASLSLSGSEAPLRVSAYEATVTNVAQQLKLVWLPIRRGVGNPSVGMLALLRHRFSRVEVYATGAHAGELGATRFELQRIGARRVVTAIEERCNDTSTPTTCESTARIYLLERGALLAPVIAPLERWATTQAANGVGSAEYHFSSGLDYLATGIQVTERLVVRDRTSGETRSSDLQRVLVLKAGGLAASAESLWRGAP